MSIKTPIYRGILQSDLDPNGFNAGGGGGGAGVPAGGAAGQSLTKIDGADYNTHWSTVTGGSGTNPLITINVKDAPYHAVGDGVADDGSSIQSALNDLVAAGGGTLFFPRGIYLCNGPFDPSTNSILKIPNVAIAAPMMSIELLGETFVNWGSSGLYDRGTVIKSTKVGTGTEPALIAANPFSGYAMSVYTSFNNIMLRVKNMIFLVSDTHMNALRLDTSGDAVVENVTASGGSGTGTGTGIWMPNTGNFAVSYANNINIGGFGWGMRIGEHFRCPCMQLGGCTTGVSFMEANDPSWANFTMLHCTHFIEFTGLHAVELFLDVEDGPPDLTTVDHIHDPSNYGSGFIKYQINQGGSAHTPNPIIVTGGSKIDLVNLVDGTSLWKKAQFQSYTVATLPASPVLGQVAAVSDGTASLAWGATVTGGGTVKYLVWYNGANWTVASK